MMDDDRLNANSGQHETGRAPMTEERAKLKLEVVKAIEQEVDLDGLWTDPEFNDDGLTSTTSLVIPIGKPRDFFRIHPERSFRRRCEMYKHQPEGVIDAEWFLVDEAMRGTFEEAKPFTLCVCIYRDGALRLWPIRLPSETDRREVVAWTTARTVARAAIDTWVKLIWRSNNEGYVGREATAGYAPDPAWDRLPTFEEIVVKAFGEKNIIRNTSHPVYRNLIGAPPQKANGGDDL